MVNFAVAEIQSVEPFTSSNPIKLIEDLFAFLHFYMVGEVSRRNKGLSRMFCPSEFWVGFLQTETVLN